MKKIIKEIIKMSGLIVLMFVFVLGTYAILEPVEVNAVEDEDDVVITQTVTSGITISAPSDISMTALTLTQDTAVGSTTWNVITNNQAGYELTIKASRTNALYENTTAEFFTDYTSSGKEVWSVASAYEFGWSALGNDVTGHGTDTTDDCAAAYDVPSAELLWEGLNGVTSIQMASSTSETNMAGTETTFCVATEQDTVFAPSGTYYATTTATAITQ